MVLINYAGREINAKIVYYGPGLSGKTTNLECIYASVPSDSRGKMVSMKTRQDRTLFFDFLPLELGEVHGFRTRFLLYTVPGQVFYNATRKLVLKGADAVVFVADSGLGKMEDNLESLRNLDENLREQGLTLEGIPFVLQYNKRDLPELYSVEELEKALNPRGVPSFEAAAASGRGVYETLHAVSRLLFQRLLTDLRPAGGRAASAPASAPAPAGPTPVRAEAKTAGRAPAAPVAPRPGPGALEPTPALAGPRPTPSTAPRAGITARPKTLEPEIGSVLPEVSARQAMRPQDDEPAVLPPQVRGASTAGSVPQPPTADRILDSVHASAQSLEITEPEPASEYPTYGHVVDLEIGAPTPSEVGPAGQPPTLRLEPEEAGIGGLIQDPLRRRDSSPRAASPAGPAVTRQVAVTLNRSELQPGRTIRILLDLRIEP